MIYYSHMIPILSTREATERMNPMKKAGAFLLAALFLFPLAGCGGNRQERQQREFDAFIQNEFISAMESDYTTAHIYLQNPADFGVDAEKIEVSLGARFDEESLRRQHEAAESTAEAFGRFDRSLLTKEQQDIYDTFEFQLRLSRQMSEERFFYYEPLFQSMSGLHYQLPTLFADWPLRSEQDAEELAALLWDVRPYVDSALEYTRKQAEKGLLMLDLQSVHDYCSGIVESGMDSAVRTSMMANVEALGLPPEQEESCKRQLEEAFSGSFLPAFEAICTTMEELQSVRNNEEGVAAFENGKSYYELLLRQNVGSDKSVEEIRKMMEEQLRTHQANLRRTLLKNPAVLNTIRTGAFPETGYTGYDQMLSDIRNRMSEDFPEVGALDYEIRDIAPELASSSGVAAYFNIPALDGNPVKQLRVNPNLEGVHTLSVYTTVAHEGFPGHMYQYAFMYEKVESDYIRALASVPAYTEGYAVYAQYEALRYLEGMDPAVLEVYMENELLTYCAIILADIGIHYDGWTLRNLPAL